MKQLAVIFTLFILFGCARSSGKTDLFEAKKLPCLSLSDAEKILGEPAQIKDSSITTVNGVLEIKLSYIALSKDTVTGRTGIIYYMFEEYPKEQDAHEVYMGFKEANAKNSPVKDFSSADEGYFQEPPGPPPFILARKGAKLFRVKINKSTIHTSSEEFMKVTKEVISRS